MTQGALVCCKLFGWWQILEIPGSRFDAGSSSPSGGSSSFPDQKRLAEGWSELAKAIAGSEWTTERGARVNRDAGLAGRLGE
jgi:hypothetical protein